MKRSVAVRPASMAPRTRLSDRHEKFVQELLSNGGHVADAYATVYRVGSKRAAYAHGCRLRAQKDVAERIAELTALAAERALVKPTELLQELAEIARADPAELTRVEIDPCPTCWSDDAHRAAAEAASAAHESGSATDDPRADCADCKGRGVPRMVITPTHELRGPARRLFQGVKQKSDGSLEVSMVDQLAARIELHKLLGLHVTRTINANVTANLPALSDLTHEQALDFLESLRPAK